MFRPEHSLRAGAMLALIIMCTATSVRQANAPDECNPSPAGHDLDCSHGYTNATTLYATPLRSTSGCTGYDGNPACGTTVTTGHCPTTRTTATTVHCSTTGYKPATSGCSGYHGNPACGTTVTTGHCPTTRTTATTVPRITCVAGTAHHAAS